MSQKPPTANLQLSLRYRLGCGRRAELAKTCKRAGITSALVVTDPGVAALPWFAETIEQARTDGLELGVFDDVRSNPVLANVEAGLAAYRDGGRDGLILCGGGSAMDTGKAIALASGHDQPLFEYEFVLGPRFKEIDGSRVPPMIALPTTSGSGSELSPGAVVTDTEAGVKRTLLHPSLHPAAVIADPEVTFELPPAITAGTGMDALTHALEALCAPGYNPMADGIALEALRLIADNLPHVYASPGDPGPRTHMMMAAGMAAVAFQKGLGLVHAMAHPVGAVTDLHHGTANAILLPYVLGHNRPAVGEQMDVLARHLDLPGSGHNAVLDWLLDLRSEVGIPHRLPDGDPVELAPRAAAEKAYLMTNPRPASEDEIRELYSRALEGRL